MEENWYTDLSNPEVQGQFGHDMIDKLTERGFYKLPFRTYKEGKPISNIVVKVCGFWGTRSVGQGIIVADSLDDFVYPFYYNGNEKCFKPNFEFGPELDEIYDQLDQENEDESHFGPGPGRK